MDLQQPLEIHDRSDGPRATDLAPQDDLVVTYEPAPEQTSTGQDYTGIGFLATVLALVLIACSPAVVIAVWQALL